MRSSPLRVATEAGIARPHESHKSPSRSASLPREFLLRVQLLRQRAQPCFSFASRVFGSSNAASSAITSATIVSVTSTSLYLV